MTASLVSQLLAPMSLQDFCQAHSQECPLHIRGSKGKFEFFFPLVDFRKNLDQVTEIRAVFAGFRQFYIRAHEIPTALDLGATICVTGLERAHPILSSKLQRLRREMNYLGELSVRAYLSPPGTGFGLHYDARNVTTLQLYGTKTWRIGSRPRRRWPTANAVLPCEIPEDQMCTVKLKPGDLLALPAGLAHSASAGSWSLSLNLAFHYEGFTYYDLFDEQIRSLREEFVSLREPIQALGNSDMFTGEELMESIRPRIALLGDLLKKLDSDPARLKSWLEARSNRGT